MFPDLPDVQDYQPSSKLRLNRVGLIGVRKPIVFSKNAFKTAMLFDFDIFVDLPPEKKGAHLSRTAETVNEILEEELAKPIDKLENLCEKVVLKLLEKHDYSGRAELWTSGEIFLSRRTPVTNMETHSSYRVLAGAIACRSENGIETRKFIGAVVRGILACPCAQEGLRESLRRRLLRDDSLSEESIERILSKIPVATHNQRASAEVIVEVSGNYSIDLEELIDILEGSMSSPLYEVLKRSDEVFVVEKVHRNTMFTEDLARLIARRIVERFPDINPSAFTLIRVISEESIHPYNVMAEITGRFDEIRGEIASNEEDEQG